MNYVQQCATDKEVWSAFDDLFGYYERNLKDKIYTYPDNKDTIKGGYDVLKTLTFYKGKPLRFFWIVFDTLVEFCESGLQKETILPDEEIDQMKGSFKALTLLLSFIEVEMSKRGREVENGKESN